MSDLLSVSPEVERALARGRPVVALETTLITHGLPAELGLEVAFELESAVRDAGAVPATIAILDGSARIGASAQSLERLAGAGAQKVNLANLAAVLACGSAGSTTVAATMALAHRAGITVFATGGIGGVHRGAVESGDVSADLTALARYPLAVVCAGAKAILDLRKTVEALETAGIPVLGYRTGEFPAFYRRRSGLRVDLRCDSVDELASTVAAHLELDRRPTGLLVVNPIPRASEMPQKVYERALARAFAALEDAPAEGREVTPVLLEMLDRFSGGSSVSANRALLVSNARLAARLARGLARGS